MKMPLFELKIYAGHAFVEPTSIKYSAQKVSYQKKSKISFSCEHAKCKAVSVTKLYGIEISNEIANLR